MAAETTAGVTTIYSYVTSGATTVFGYTITPLGKVTKFVCLTALGLISYPFKSKPISEGPKDTVMNDAESDSSDDINDFFQERPGPQGKIWFKTKYTDVVSAEEARESYYRTTGAPTYPIANAFPIGPINIPTTTIQTPQPVQPIAGDTGGAIGQEVEIDDNNLL